MAQPLHLGLRTIMLLVLTLWLGLLPLSSTRVVAPLPAAADVLEGHVIIPDLNSPLSQNLTAEHHHLGKRALDKESIAKGKRLDCLMSATIENAQRINGGKRLEADFDEYEILALEEEGWYREEKDPKYGSSGIRDNLGTLIPGANFANTFYEFYVNKDSGTRGNDPNHKTQPTGAYFSNGLNIQAGLIIADDNRSPRAALGVRDLTPYKNSISRIVQWDQAAFGAWEFVANGIDVPATRISYVIRSWITNTATQDQIIEALKGMNVNNIPAIANRQVFSRTSTNQAEVDGFYAMLGTPNGAATGYLLATHKAKIGIKRVSEIAIWNHPVASPVGLDRQYFKINMLFTFEVVANPTDNTPNPEPTLR